MKGNVEARVAALETQMQNLTNIVQQLTQAQARTQQQLDQTVTIINEASAIANETLTIVNEASAIARSNARSIQAWEALIEQNKVEAEEELSRQAVMIRDIQEANRENVLQHMEFRQRFDETQAAINRILDRLGGNE